MVSISAVLPAYNEEALIGETVRGVAEALGRVTSDYEIVVVNDGSRDRTREVVLSLAAQDSRVRLVSHSRNRGYGAAVATGFASATKELVFLTDGDKQFDAREIERLMPELQRADIAIGYRSPRRDPAIRRLNGWGWNLLVNSLFGYVARDVDCAFKLFRRDILRTLKVYTSGATFSAEFLIKARRQGYRIAEVPVSHYPRRAGQATGAKPEVILRAFRELLWLRFHLQEDPSRVSVFEQVPGP